jgi:radical SAM protein with 4Fe4S-binding SPASM domain
MDKVNDKARSVSDRAGVIGGSDLVNFYEGVSWACQRKLAYRFLGIEPNFKPIYNPAMRLGHFFEPILRNKFSEFIETECYESEYISHPVYKHLGVHPDGIFGDNGIIEIKAVGLHSYNRMLTQGVYEYYLDQLILGMNLSNRFAGYFVIGCTEDIENLHFFIPCKNDMDRYKTIIENTQEFVAIVNEDHDPWSFDKIGKRKNGLKRTCMLCEFRDQCMPECLNDIYE